MFTSVLLLSAILTIQGIFSKQCPNNDCMSYTVCPEALKRAQNDKSDPTTQLFRNAYCGRDKKDIKVCCSDFQLAQVFFETRVMTPDRETSLNPGTKIKGVKQDDTDNTIANIHLLPNICGDILGSRIVGGKSAALYEFPWMALISYQTDNGRQFQCAGSIINTRYILTAAHCVENKNIAGVRVGEYDIENDFDCESDTCEEHIQDIQIDTYFCHKKYIGYPYYEHDIALIRLEKDIDFSHKNVKPICLPVSKDLRSQSIANKQATVAGWGLTERNKASDTLLKVTIPVRAIDVCQNYYSFMTDDTKQFCAGSMNKDSCRGDSGGPLMIEGFYDGFQKFVQYGIVSNGPASCGTQSPGVYTDVRKYMDWILTIINKHK